MIDWRRKMDEFRNAYDEDLISALMITEYYQDIRNLKGINEYIFTKEFVFKFLNYIINFFKIEKSILSMEFCRNNILQTINDMRYNYKCDSEEEKDEFYRLCNECILLTNNAVVSRYVTVDVETKNKVRKKQVDVRNQELQAESEFYFIYFYLTDIENFEEKGLPLLCLNPSYLIFVYACIHNLPEILKEPDFLTRTQRVLEVSLQPNCIKEYGLGDYEKSLVPVFKKIKKEIDKKTK